MTIPKVGNGERGKFRWVKETKSFERVSEFKRVVNAPAVIVDEIPPTESMATADREFFTSKKKLRAHYREHGFIETGGEKAKPEPVDREKRRREIRDDAEKALMDLKYKRIPISEEEQQRCKEEERQYQEWLKRNWLN